MTRFQVALAVGGIFASGVAAALVRAGFGFTTTLLVGYGAIAVITTAVLLFAMHGEPKLPQNERRDGRR
jgi:hypothetical protein